MIIMNRNTSPISPLKKDYYQDLPKMSAYNQYPDQEIARFKANYSHWSGLTAENLELANGSDEWIQKAFLTLGRQGIVSLNPDFVMYQAYANQFDLDIYYVDAELDFSFSKEKIIQKVKETQSKLLILSNPHNPTGHQFSESFLQDLADLMAKEQGYLVIDEAYVEFGKAYQPPKGDHVVLMRTLSKIYGLAGLRIGVIHAQGKTFDRLTSINHPYPLNSMTLNIASRLMEDRAHLQAFFDYQKRAQAALVNSFQQVADVVTVMPSYTNFVFTYGDRAKDLYNFLKTHGYWAKAYDESILQDTARYSIIQLEEYESFNRLLKEWRRGLKKHISE